MTWESQVDQDLDQVEQLMIRAGVSKAFEAQTFGRPRIVCIAWIERPQQVGSTLCASLIVAARNAVKK